MNQYSKIWYKYPTNGMNKYSKDMVKYPTKHYNNNQNKGETTDNNNQNRSLESNFQRLCGTQQRSTDLRLPPPHEGDGSLRRTTQRRPSSLPRPCGSSRRVTLYRLGPPQGHLTLPESRSTHRHE